MIVTSAKYISETIENKDGTSETNNVMIKATIDGTEMFVPLDESNRHRKAIKDWEDAGNTIEEAE
jgi:hypothetical protein|tara:strand:- start:492 stop:686 length:195 start_codon:yes stop_codon:yes gene_type:complete